MIAIDGVPLAIMVMLFGMFFLGTAPAIWNKVERAGRIPSHTMLDYIVSYVLVGVITTLTLGQLGPPPADGRPNFLDQIRQPNGPVTAFALASGVFLGIGDVALQYAVAFLGLAIGPPIMNALTVILGILISYFLDGGMNAAYLVFPGMALAALAIGLGVVAHLTSTAVQERQKDKSGRGQQSTQDITIEPASFNAEQASNNASQADYTLAIVCINSGMARKRSSSGILPLDPTAATTSDAKGSGSELTTQRSCRSPLVLSRQPTGNIRLRSVQKADSSIYLGLAIAIAGECLTL
jgi:hypothetical protein